MQSADWLKRMPLPPRCWINRYGAPEVCDKGHFARMARACKDLCSPEYFSFNPGTWVLPEQLPELRATLEKSKATFIVKPEDGSQGDGIFLVQGLRQFDVKISMLRNAVVQKYISKPLLLNGLKFDLRMYVCIAGGSDVPMSAWVCREGLARFCTETYERPSQQNMHHCMSHLTNYSLNKRSENFEHCAESLDEVFGDENVSSKRPLTVCLRQLAQEHEGFDVDAFYDSVLQIAQRCTALFGPVLAAQSRQMRCFQVFGFDVMLDENFKTYLLEVNNSPSLCIDEALPVAEADRKGKSREKDKEKVCYCMDMAQAHRHQTALVDLEVKSLMMSGAFRRISKCRRTLSWGRCCCGWRFSTTKRAEPRPFPAPRCAGPLLPSAEEVFRRPTWTSWRRSCGCL
ncbi:unnamed protein product [Effrenium voratum]|nr:unnamed protein product [Effrenium voratum]